MTCKRGCCETQREHYMSISISATAMPTRKPAIASQEDTVRNVDKNRNAYARLRKEGLQPRSVMKSAELEARAEDKLEIQTGDIYGKDLKIAKEVDALSKASFKKSVGV